MKRAILLFILAWLYTCYLAALLPKANKLLSTEEKRVATHAVLAVASAPFMMD